MHAVEILRTKVSYKVLENLYQHLPFVLLVGLQPQARGPRQGSTKSPGNYIHWMTFVQPSGSRTSHWAKNCEKTLVTSPEVIETTERHTEGTKYSEPALTPTLFSRGHSLMAIILIALFCERRVNLRRSKNIRRRRTDKMETRARTREALTAT